MTTAVERAPDFYLRKQAADRWSNYFRARRFDLIAAEIRRIAATRGQCRIIDIGGREEYWRPILPVLEETRARVTVVNLEKTQPQSGPRFDFRYGNACDLSDIESRSFDFVHSNSLIEHVGRFADMKRCADEVRRLAPSYYVQTPYLWFPIEPHYRVPFFAWLPEAWRARLTMMRGWGYIARAETLEDAMREVQGINLLDKTQMQALFPDADVKFERVLGLPKSMLAIRRAD